MVARAVGDGDADLTAHLVSLVAPPVATARYLRRAYGDRRVHITFVGACPSAGDSAIDAWLTPLELLERFGANAIDLARQPQLFESVLPPDRRRHLSQPGGMPTSERAAALPRPRQVVEIDDTDVMASIRRHLMSGVRTLVDVAPRLGCACSGAMPGVSSAEARLAVTMLEPPRSPRPVMVDPVGLALVRRVPPRLRPDVDLRRPPEGSPPARGARVDAQRDAERTVATPRPASRSPLSWNLRERALPQPPTSGLAHNPAEHRGASSAAWSALEATRPDGGADQSSRPAITTSSSGGAVDVDATTAAAVRALEAAAKGSGAVVPSGETRDEPASAPEDPSGSERESGPRTSRATPSGGYWFVSVAGAGGSDTEVERDPPSVEDGASHVDSNVAPTGEGEDIVAAATDDSATNASEADGGVPPDAGALDAPRSSPDREGEPPDRAWVVAMTIILLIAGALVAQRITHRRTVEPRVTAVPSITAHAGAIADVVALAPVSPPSSTTREMAESVFAARDAEVQAIREELAKRAAKLDSMGRVVGSLFVAPRVLPEGAHPPRPAPPPRVR
jgi:hypothetical protein